MQTILDHVANQACNWHELTNILFGRLREKDATVITTFPHTAAQSYGYACLCSLSLMQSSPPTSLL